MARKVFAALNVRGARVDKPKKPDVRINAPDPFHKYLLYELKLNQPVSPIPVLCEDMMEISGFCCWRGRECKFCSMDTVSCSPIKFYSTPLGQLSLYTTFAFT
jgi:hypothetical protein